MVARSVSPEFKLQYCQKKRKKESNGNKCHSGFAPEKVARGNSMRKGYGEGKELEVSKVLKPP
jgi:hypothetical protein